MALGLKRYRRLPTQKRAHGHRMLFSVELLQSLRLQSSLCTLGACGAVSGASTSARPTGQQMCSCTTQPSTGPALSKRIADGRKTVLCALVCGPANNSSSFI